MEWVRLEQAQWRTRQRRHTERATTALSAVIERRRTGARHPVEDFLFDYYRLRPAELTSWHPGIGFELAEAGEFAARRQHVVDADGTARVDVDAVLHKRGRTLEFTHRLLSRTAERPAQFDCFGLHEWAMVYRLPAEQLRHQRLGLRLSPEQTDAVVESHDLRCSHFDAFRFFTPEAVGLNRRPLTRDDQLECDQGGCLHVNMDLYKWAGKMSPLVGSELLFDCFELARDIRELDMRASPYDVSEWGHSAVKIETAEGKSEYVAAQRGFSLRAAALRSRLLAVTTHVAAWPVRDAASR